VLAAVPAVELNCKDVSDFMRRNGRHLYGRQASRERVLALGRAEKLALPASMAAPQASCWPGVRVTCSVLEQGVPMFGGTEL
jgi:hypothetical protein